MRYLLIMIFVIGCGSSEEESSSSDAVTVEIEKEGWTPNKKSLTRLNCENSSVASGNTARGSVVYCDCVIGTIEERYTYEHFIVNEIKITSDLTNDGTIDTCVNKAREGFALIEEVYHEDFNTHFSLISD